MTAPVVSLASYRLKQAAIRKGERVRGIATELYSVAPELREEVAADYCQMGWCSHAEAREALRALEELEG